MGNVFSARELWASSGVPYQEPDRVTTTSDTPVIRELLYCGTARLRANIFANATQLRPLALNTSLRSNAIVVEP